MKNVRICVLVVLVLMAPIISCMEARAVDEDTNLVENGSFLNAPDARKGEVHANGYTLRLAVGARSVPGWSIMAGNVELLTGLSQSRKVWMMLRSGGTVATRVQTTPGKVYQLEFTMGGPGIETFAVTVGKQRHSFPVQQGYSEQKVPFTASARSTTITFFAACGGLHGGPFFGSVAVREVDAARVEAQKAIEATYSRYYAALRTRDYTSAFSVLAPDFEAVTPKGERLGREEFQASVRASRPPADGATLSYEVRKVKLGPNGEASVVCVDRYIYVAYDRLNKQHVYRVVHPYSDVWKLTGQTWKAKQRQASPVEFYVDDKRSEAPPDGRH